MHRTKQEIFDYVWNHFVVQKNPLGYDVENDNCSYKLGCALGCFFPKDFDTSAIEGDAFIGFSINDKRIVDTTKASKLITAVTEYVTSNTSEEMGRFLSDLQRTHDMTAVTPGADISKTLLEFARNKGLTVPPA